METQALVDALSGWSGDAEEAERLRAAVRDHPTIRLTGPPAPGWRALAKVVEIASSPGKSPAALANWLSKDKNASEAPVLAPLLGDPELGDWPWTHPLDVSEEEGVKWLNVLALTHPLVTEPIRRFIRIFFQIRRRQIWPAAARCWAALAHDDQELRREMKILWSASFPDLGDRWPRSGGLSRERDRLGEDAAHLVRHTLLLGAAWHAGEGDPEVGGASAAELVDRPLPKDDADCSVVLESLAVAWSHHQDDSWLPAVAKRAREVGVGELSLARARKLVEVLPEGRASSALRQALIRAKWQSAGVDALWEWLNTAAWFQHRGDTEAVEAMRQRAGTAATALALRLGTDLDAPVERLVDHLRHLLDPDRYAVIPLRRRAPMLAETRLLMGHPDVQPLPWPPIVRLALDGVEDRPEVTVLDGPVSEVGEPSLGVTLARRKLTSRTLMRNVPLSRDNVLAIGSLQNGFVATQVAVQTERILREVAARSDDEARGNREKVRFLWKLLQCNPPAKTFAELDLVLRTDLVLPQHGDVAERIEYGSSPLHRMVKSVSHLDRRRDEGASIDTIADSFAELVRETRTLLEGAGDEVSGALDALAHALEIAAEDEDDPLTDSWLNRLDAVILGDRHRGGLIGWAWWLSQEGDGDLDVLASRRTEVEKALVRLRSAVELLREARPSVTIVHFDEICEASDDVRDKLGALGWPESRMIAALLDRLVEAAKDALSEGRRSRAVVEQLNSVLDRGDEDGLNTLLRDESRVALLPIDQLKRTHRFLLGHLRFGDAAHLRRAVSNRISLPHRIAYMMPLYGAVAGGTFLVLDLGEAWLGLVGDGAWVRYGVTLALTNLASYGLLLNDLAPRISTTGSSAFKRWIILSLRVLPTYTQAALVSVVVSALAMATLGSFAFNVTSALSLALWASLALFLGVFVGLILQGQSVSTYD